MRLLSCCLAASMIFIGGCTSDRDDGGGEEVTAEAPDESAARYQRDFETAFVDGFRSQFIPGCATAVVSRGVDQADAETMCACVADVMIRDYAPMEIAGATDEQFAAAAAECREIPEQSDG
ncbi:hypothetical protein HFP51_08360 [Parasphingopyxis sp. CP4]|uniref:hypothetical protein n=1 Tax=Parasphingopyxis sp. CP4 TaxID=2724527 RepID=UPI0015A48F07|nr:hypothetical protein [Parasphingopyxis sp. CP4]QLC22188.1 hypothetical protein HFP51_08360 [Parasphingopyxis sp. CP4]